MQEQSQPVKMHSLWRDILAVGFGVVLPLATLGVELLTRMCASIFFDPLPTLGHVILVAAVPAVNLLCWLAYRFGRRSPLDLTLMTGVVIVIAASYAVMFLPLSVLGLLFPPIGLLPMAPLSSLIVAFCLLPRLEPEKRRSTKRFWAGVALGAALLIAVQAPSAVTRLGIQMAASDSPVRSANGVRILRAVGSRRYLLLACYDRLHSSNDPLSFALAMAKPVPLESVRLIYHRVTGHSYNSVPPPTIHGVEMGSWRDSRLQEQGQTAVAGRLQGLKLIESRQDGSIDPVAALGYIEWTMVFGNESDGPLEARAELALPPGAVVSRATLWINGEEREAAFGTRERTTAAYQKVVARRRDPLLVTTHGRDRILVQCFPVNPDSDMKIRIGMTVPLPLQSLQTGLFVLPRLNDANFRVPKSLLHRVWLESSAGLSAAEDKQPGKAVLRVGLTNSQLNGTKGLIRFDRPTGSQVAWSFDPTSKGAFVRQIISEQAADSPQNVVFVVDASKPMKAFAAPLPEVIEKLPPHMKVTILLAGDRVVETAGGLTPADAAQRLRAALKSFRFVGGQDNVPGLVRAFEKAGSRSDSAIVWIHGTQPVFPGSAETLRQWHERSADLPFVYHYQVSDGPSDILGKLDDTQLFMTISRIAGIRHDMESFLRQWAPESRKVVVKRERLNGATSPGADAQKTSDHLCRLWAADRVAALVAENSPSASNEAERISVAYRLVTPVSGAVVLESQWQYNEAGLRPADEVPTIPEPGEWALLAVTLAVLAAVLVRRKRVRPCSV